MSLDLAEAGVRAIASAVEGVVAPPLEGGEEDEATTIMEATRGETLASNVVSQDTILVIVRTNEDSDNNN